MKKILFFALALTGIAITGCEKKPTADSADNTNSITANPSNVPGKDNLTLDTPEAKASYSIGVDIGRNLKRSTEDLSLQALRVGLRDGFQEDTTLLNDEEMRQVIMNYRKDLIAKREVKRKEMSTNNLAKGEIFLKENAKKEGVVTLPSGLQYKVLKEGTGAIPTATNMVTTHYVGTLIDGTEFDSSLKRGQPATFPVSGVIPGWTEALKLMKVGSKWQLVVPPKLGYGENGAGDKIGPNATLIFEVELLDIKK